jgi:hypothetical protein
MAIPNQAKVIAAARAIRDALERIIGEHLLSDAADGAPSVKVVAGTVVMMSAAHYARKLGLPKEIVIGIAGTSYDMGDVPEPSGPNPSGPKTDET